MNSPLSRLLPLPLLILAALSLPPGPARAQWMSAWGHPVVTFGWTPYDAVSTGHGYYPGSNGYIPGYGYYPGPGPDHYPWYDGPDDRHPAAGPGPAAVAGDAVAPTAAVLRVRIAADADLLVNGWRTAQRGAQRVFVSPPLAEGHQLTYDLLALWTADGHPRAWRKKVEVFPGDRLTLDFRDGAPAAAEEATPLGPPRKLPRP
jgi:uncharacterized protein (TIGR03000 family)